MSAAIVPTSASADDFDLGDPRFGLGKLALELGLDLLALGLGLGLGGVVRGLADGIGLGARFGKLLLVGGDRGVGLRLHARGLVEILRDALAAHLQDAADARQRHPLQEQVEQPEE